MIRETRWLDGAVSLLGLCSLLSYIVPFCLGAWHAVAINEFITRVLIRGYHRWVTEATQPSTISRVT